MSETLTKAAARNIFYGGTAFFFAVFVALTAHSVTKANAIAAANPVTPGVAAGKHVWEKHSCINCHTLMGEGAYYAPELGNVWVRFGGKEDPNGAREALKAWMKGQPSGVEGRRQMPQFNLTETELDNLADFFKWTSEVDTQNWPPKVSG
ncbi:cytochrome c [Magnetospirillum sp. 64-120]|uniref:c-type cytochrome n=1 Tax=Magnetospirillum sp. 64-120 TaxID=1895778 RepID=UPI0009279F6E|nr:cytochrome c [Magnetospirillum sp. 64-120]OJX74794.1 MAG: cytochrome C [Magnetospirillum sp. 64-120]